MAQGIAHWTLVVCVVQGVWGLFVHVDVACAVNFVFDLTWVVLWQREVSIALCNEAMVTFNNWLNVVVCVFSNWVIVM